MGKMKFSIQALWARKLQTVQWAQFAWGSVALVVLFVLSRNMLKYGVGQGKLRDICLMLVLLISLSASRKTLTYVLVPFVVLISLYIPIGYSFGVLTENQLMAAYATDATEAMSMLPMFAKTGVLLAVLNMVLCMVYYKICVHRGIQLYRNKLLIVLVTAIGLSNQVPFAFFTNAYNNTIKVQQEVAKMAHFSQQSGQDSWGTVAPPSGNAYDDYVVVIGESARVDYFHVYGYPVANTPFLDQAPGVFVSGLQSADRYTIPSLTRMLTKNHPQTHQAQYDKNIVTLAKKAGYVTHWLSNQGSIGAYDTPIAAIAKQAHSVHFLKQGAYNIRETSDFALVGAFKQRLQSASHKQRRLFVIHTVGSHPDVCEKLRDFPHGIQVRNQAYLGVACYVRSIQKTDALLQQIHAALVANERSQQRRFSMVYFSDHGLNTEERDGQWQMVHGDVLQSTAVPLLKLSSGDTEHEMVQQAKSGLYFTDGLAKWLGISHAQLQDYDLFSSSTNKHFEVDFPKFESSPDNPALDVSQH